MVSRSSLLICDIGGTYIRFAFFEKGSSSPFDVWIEPHGKPKNFFDFLNSSSSFQNNYSIKPFDRIVIAAAGPRIGSSIKMTNLSWTLEQTELESFFKKEVLLFNDLEAAVFSLPFLGEDDSILLNGKPGEGIKGLIYPGTGLGEAFVVSTKNSWIPCPSEGGNTFWVPTTPREKEIYRHLSFPLTEELLSGPGLSRLHAILTGETLSPEEIILGQEKRSETLEFFAEALLREASQFALRVLPKGGLFLAGRLVQSLVPFLEDTRPFLNHPKHQTLLEKIPLYILKEENLVVKGAFLLAHQSYNLS